MLYGGTDGVGLMQYCVGQAVCVRHGILGSGRCVFQLESMICSLIALSYNTRRAPAPVYFSAYNKAKRYLATDAMKQY